MPDEHILLKGRGHMAGYSAQVGQGKSLVLGTLPGGCYATSVYYQLASTERAELRRFAVELMESAGVPRLATSDLEVECVRRRLPDGSWLLFVLNRLGEQRGTLTLSLEGGADYAIETLYAYKDSSAEKHAFALALSLRLAADDVLVLRLVPR
jgi:hypothetical protein